MSDSIKTIRTAIEGRIEGLAGGFTKLDNKFDLKKNNFSNEDKRYGVIAQTGDNSPTILCNITIDRTFEITICNKFISTNNGDASQEAIGDLLESFMEEAIVDITNSKLGLPGLVLQANYSDNEEVDYEEVENLAFLKFNIIVQYRKAL